MSQIKATLYVSVLAFALSLSGCGDTNSKVTFSPDSGKHLPGWTPGHSSSARAEIDSCTECHGEDLSGGISLVSCMSPTPVSGFKCHATSPVDNPTDCITCHGGSPYGPYGSTAPNRKFAHGKHTLLTGCATCHLNAGFGTVNHAKASAAGGFKSATVTLASAFRAKKVTATFSFNAASGKCFGVSCHGGKDTPTWSTGSISITDCVNCHEQGTAAATPQYNSFYSGSYDGTNLHTFHLEIGALCTECHNIGTLTDYQKHFAGVITNTFTAPGMTIGGAPTKIGSYDTTLRECSNISCHSFVPITMFWEQ